MTRTAGLMNPNHYLAASIAYLFQHRPDWRADSAVGKTLVSSSMIDRVAAKLGRRCSRCRSASNGSSMACSTARSASAARRARAPPSCAGRHGVDHRQGRPHPRPAGRGDHRRDRPRPGRALHALTAGARQVLLRAHRRAGHAAEQKQLLKTLTPERIGATQLGGDPIDRRR